MAGLVAICGCVGASALAQNPPRVAGGNAQQRRVLLTSLRLLKARDISVTIGHSSPAGTSGEVNLSFEGRNDAESQWKDEIAAGVYAAHGFKLTWLEIPSRGGAGIHPVRGPLDPISTTQLREAIREAARRARVQVATIQLLRLEVVSAQTRMNARNLDLQSWVRDSDCDSPPTLCPARPRSNLSGEVKR